MPIDKTPKITFIKNIDDEIIYPKTHEDAVLTADGSTLTRELQNISNTITTEIGKVNDLIASKNFVHIGDTAPESEILWLDTSNNVFKYKVQDKWEILGTNLKFKQED